MVVEEEGGMRRACWGLGYYVTCVFHVILVRTVPSSRLIRDLLLRTSYNSASHAAAIQIVER